MPHPVKLGENVRMSYGKINEVLEMPNLIEIQTNSYKWFLEEGLKEVFHDVSPITDYTGNLILEFIDYHLENTPKYDIEECKERDATYAAPLRVKVRLINKESGEVKEQEIHGRLSAHDALGHVYHKRRRTRYRLTAGPLTERLLFPDIR